MRPKIKEKPPLDHFQPDNVKSEDVWLFGEDRLAFSLYHSFARKHAKDCYDQYLKRKEKKT